MNIQKNTIPNWQAHVTVATIVTKTEQVNGKSITKYLLVEEYADKKAQTHIVINQPAGHAEAGETLVEACIRETFEETGWHVDVSAFLGVYTYQPEAEKTYYRFCFLAKTKAFDEKAVLDDGIVKASWYSHAELKQKDNMRSLLVLKCIEDFEAGKNYPLDMVQEFLL